jgi:hypothetical protein
MDHFDFIGEERAAEKTESWAAKASREVQLVTAGMAGIADAAIDAFDADKLPMTALELGVSIGLGAAMARYAPGKSLTGLILRTQGAIMGLAFAKDIAMGCVELGSVLSDNWNSNANWRSNEIFMRDRIGTFAFDTALMAAGGLAGMKFGSRLTATDLGHSYGSQTHLSRIAEQKLSAPIQHERLTPHQNDCTVRLNWIDRDGINHNLQPAPVTDKRWHGIYESQFPPNERQPYEFLESLAESGSVPHVKIQVTERAGKTAAFSMTSDYGDSIHGRTLLLPYIAVDGPVQAKGVGTKHLQFLNELTKNNYPTAKGMLVEIEDPMTLGITNSEGQKRLARLRFYERNGGELLSRPYMIPSEFEGEPAIAGKLMWLDFGRGGLTQEALTDSIRSIYKHGYELSPDHPLMLDLNSAPRK